MRDILAAPVLIVALGMLAAAGCGETVGSPTPTIAPTATVDAGQGTPAATPEVEIPVLIAPFELTSVGWPIVQAEAITILDAMPENIGGMSLVAGAPEPTLSERRIRYTSAETEDLLQLVAFDLTSGDFFPPNWTPADIVAHQIISEDTREAGREGDVVWSFITTTESGRDLFGLLWGAADGKTLFSAVATTEELLEELVVATVDAAQPDEERE